MVVVQMGFSCWWICWYNVDVGRRLVDKELERKCKMPIYFDAPLSRCNALVPTNVRLVVYARDE